MLVLAEWVAVMEVWAEVLAAVTAEWVEVRVVATEVWVEARAEAAWGLARAQDRRNNLKMFPSIY